MKIDNQSQKVKSSALASVHAKVRHLSDKNSAALKVWLVKTYGTVTEEKLIEHSKAICAYIDELQPPLEAAPFERRLTFKDICTEYVWLGTLGRFVERANPEVAYKKEQFNDRFGYIMKKGKLTDELFAHVGTIPKLTGMIYRPDAGEFVDGYWNGWRKSPITPKEGDTTWFHNHLEYLFSEDDQALLLNWMAGVLQNLAVKPRHQLLIRGRTQGTGKTFFSRLMTELIGKANSQALTQDILSSGFTGWAMFCKLVTVEEIRNFAVGDVTKKLHPWASESVITVNQKNLPTFCMDQSIAMMLNSNQDDPLAVDDSDRRYLMLKTEAEKHPDGAPYYDALYDGVLKDPAALGAIFWELLHRDLGGYSIQSDAPWTDAKAETIAASAGDVLQWMVEHRSELPTHVLRLSDIEERLPYGLRGRGALKAITKALQSSTFNAYAWPVQVRPEGHRESYKVRVWLLGDVAARARAGKLKHVEVVYLYGKRMDADEAEAAKNVAGDFDYEIDLDLDGPTHWEVQHGLEGV